MSYETVRTENNLEAEQHIAIRRKMHRLWITCNRFEIGARRLSCVLAPAQKQSQAVEPDSRSVQHVRIDKWRMETVKWSPSTVSHDRANRECGAETRFQFRSCPRNCKRRARATEPLGQPGKAVTGGRPASQETCR
jgi:hypothetical protein